MTSADRPGESFDSHYWEARYQGHSATGPRDPNPHLVAETADLAPGTALDAGCGEGADTIWLASRGWRVTAVDVSATAVQRGRERAEALGADVAARIEWVQADLALWTAPAAGFDLVSSHYVHLPADVPPGVLFQRLASWVAPGGTLLVAGHDASDHATGPHAPAPGSHVTAEEIAADLDPAEWGVLVAETRSLTRRGPHGQEIPMRDAVVRARRRP